MANNFYFVLISVLFIVVIKKFFKKPNKPETFKEEINERLKAQTQNKWLYPEDEFGKMEEGVVYDSKTYKRDITKEEAQQEIFNIN